MHICFLLKPFLNSMTTLPHAEHSVRKKAYSPHYTPANLALFQPELHDLVVKLSDVSPLPKQPHYSD